MIKLRIIDIDDNNYLLEDKDNNKYSVYIIFYDIKENVEKFDYIYLSSDIINNKNIYAFGPILDKNINMSDAIIIEKEDEKIYLQRYYG